MSEVGFTIIKIVDEHITDVGSGERNVYTILIKNSNYVVSKRNFLSDYSRIESKK